jgi:hypothetical protein
VVHANEVTTMGLRLLGEARALRAAFPETGAMAGLPISDLPAAPPGDAEDVAGYPVLGYLRDEMLVVRAGRAKDLTVLDDEIAAVERLLGHGSESPRSADELPRQA